MTDDEGFASPGIHDIGVKLISLPRRNELGIQSVKARDNLVVYMYRLVPSESNRETSFLRLRWGRGWLTVSGVGLLRRHGVDVCSEEEVCWLMGM